ncbi:MAG: hypothetical protein NVS9B15_25020 [Acidobacteriaceae bacterium]
MKKKLNTDLQRGLHAILMLAVAVIPVAAQISTANVSGIVSDAQNARISGVTVTASNAATGFTASVKTDANGLYAVPSLPIGSYSVRAERDGFNSVLRSPVVLTVGRDAVLDFTLSVGQVSQEVNVTGDAPQVETSSNAVSWLVGPEQVRQLPLNGRNLTQLTLLAPGVQPVAQENTEGAATLVPFGFGSPQRFSVAGGRPQGQLFLLDGTDTAGVWGNGTGANLVGTTLGVDSVAEFEVLTNTYSAAYGGNGGVVNAAYRSGTNDWHGSAYEFARNSALDARNFFDPTSGALPFSRNQFGGTFGGPIKQNKTFFFTNYEGLRQQLTVPVFTTVPDANFRNGMLPCNQVVIFPCNGATGLASVGVAPGVQAILNAFPAPNGTVFGNGTALNISHLSQPVREDYGVVKLDHTLSASDSLSMS